MIDVARNVASPCRHSVPSNDIASCSNAYEGKKAAGAFVATLRKNFSKSSAREVHQRGAKYLGNDFRRVRIAKIKKLCRSYKLTAERNIAEVKIKKALRMGLIGRHF
jgi:hypothetical protein